MKKIVVLASALILASGVTVFGQTTKTTEKKDAPKPATTTVKQEPAKTTTASATPATVKPSTATKTMIAENQLPKAAQDYLTKTYPNKKVDQAMKITEPNGTVMYMAEMGNLIAHFDMAGKFIKETKKEEKPAGQAKVAPAPVKAQPATAPDKNKQATAPAKK